MRIFKFLLISCFLFSFVQCKKDRNTRYEIVETSSFGDNLNKDKDKTNIEFHSILSTNLFQKPS